jgi:hypothetical protein
MFKQLKLANMLMITYLLLSMDLYACANMKSKQNNFETSSNGSTQASVSFNANVNVDPNAVINWGANKIGSTVGNGSISASGGINGGATGGAAGDASGSAGATGGASGSSQGNAAGDAGAIGTVTPPPKPVEKVVTDFSLEANLEQRCVKKFATILANYPKDIQKAFIKEFYAAEESLNCCNSNTVAEKISKYYNYNVKSFADLASKQSKDSKVGMSCFKSINHLQTEFGFKDDTASTSSREFIKELLMSQNQANTNLAKCTTELNKAVMKNALLMCGTDSFHQKVFNFNENGVATSPKKSFEINEHIYKSCSEFFKSNEDLSKNASGSLIDSINYTMGLPQCSYFSNNFKFDIEEDQDDPLFPQRLGSQQVMSTHDLLVDYEQCATLTFSQENSDAISKLLTDVKGAMKENPNGLSTYIGRSDINYDIIKQTFYLNKFNSFLVRCKNKTCQAICDGCDNLNWPKDEVVLTDATKLKVSCCNKTCLVYVEINDMVYGETKVLKGAEIFYIREEKYRKGVDPLLVTKLRNADQCFYKNSKEFNKGNDAPTIDNSVLHEKLQDVVEHPNSFLIDTRFQNALKLKINVEGTNISIVDYFSKHLIKDNNSFSLMCAAGKCSYDCLNCDNKVYDLLPNTDMEAQTVLLQMKKQDGGASSSASAAGNTQGGAQLDGNVSFKAEVTVPTISINGQASASGDGQLASSLANAAKSAYGKLQGGADGQGTVTTTTTSTTSSSTGDASAQGQGQAEIKAPEAPKIDYSKIKSAYATANLNVGHNTFNTGPIAEYKVADKIEIPSFEPQYNLNFNNKDYSGKTDSSFGAFAYYKFSDAELSYASTGYDYEVEGYNYYFRPTVGAETGSIMNYDPLESISNKLSASSNKDYTPLYNPLDWIIGYDQSFSLNTYEKMINSNLSNVRMAIECCKAFCVTYVDSINDNMDNPQGKKLVYLDFFLRFNSFLNPMAMNNPQKQCLISNFFTSFKPKESVLTKPADAVSKLLTSFLQKDATTTSTTGATGTPVASTTSTSTQTVVADPNTTSSTKAAGTTQTPEAAQVTTSTTVTKLNTTTTNSNTGEVGSTPVTLVEKTTTVVPTEVPDEDDEVETNVQQDLNKNILKKCKVPAIFDILPIKSSCASKLTTVCGTSQFRGLVTKNARKYTSPSSANKCIDYSDCMDYQNLPEEQREKCGDKLFTLLTNNGILIDIDALNDPCIQTESSAALVQLRLKSKDTPHDPEYVDVSSFDDSDNKQYNDATATSTTYAANDVEIDGSSTTTTNSNLESDMNTIDSVAAVKSADANAKGSASGLKVGVFTILMLVFLA